MTASSVVRARIDDNIKQEASIVLASMGLTVSDAMRMMLTRVAREQALPFEPLVPNAATIKAMKDARSGKTKKHATLESLVTIRQIHWSRSTGMGGHGRSKYS